MKYLTPKLILFLIAGFSFSTFSQILQFEKKYETEANYISGLAETDDQAIMILCELLDSTWNDTSSLSTYFYHTLLYKVNLDGDILWSKTFYNYTKEIAWTEEILKTNDGNFLLFGNSEHDTHLLKMNQDGDSLWTESISIQTPDPYPIYGNKQFVHQAFETCDNDILILLNHDNRILISGAPYSSTLMKINEMGNLLWEHSLPGIFASKMVINKDNNIVLCKNNQTNIFGLYGSFYPVHLNQNNSVGLQTYNQNGLLINEINFPFIFGIPNGLVLNSNQEIFISARMFDVSIPVPTKSTYVPHSLIMKTDAFENETWTRDYIGNMQSLLSLANNRLLAVSWPYVKTINYIGDSINGYQYSYELKHSQSPLFLITGNDLYQAGMIAGEDSLMISKIDASLISSSDYTPLDGYSQSLDMYPNPASRFINIDLTSIRQSDLTGIIYSDKMNVFVYDNSGRLVKEAEHYFVNNLLQLPVDNLDNGLYFFKISYPGMDVITEKIMVSH